MIAQHTLAQIAAVIAGRQGLRQCRAARRQYGVSARRRGTRSRDLMIRLPSGHPSRAKPVWSSWPESFLFAGTSGLLLLVVNYFPQYWYLSFLALSPLLFRMLVATPREAWQLGFLFGLTFLSVSALQSASFSLLPAASKVLVGTAILGLFGWLVGHARLRWGFNPIMIALLWVAFEPWLVKLGFTSGLFRQAEVSHPLLNGVGGLFGFLIISLIIVLCNSLLAWVIKKAASPAERSTSW